MRCRDGRRQAPPLLPDPGLALRSGVGEQLACSRGAHGSLLVALLLLFLAGRGVAFAKPPNVVLIVADDLGYSDLGSYGGEIDTPHLDRLAFAGVRFGRFYATPRCSPTRAALLTGVWSHEAGVAHLAHDWARPAYRGAIAKTIPTLAERLRAAGYSTYMAGKWHLTPELRETRRERGEGAAPGNDGTGETAGGGTTAAGDEPPASWPTQRGFDRFYGTLVGSGSYFEPPHLYDGNQPTTLDATPAGAAADSAAPGTAANAGARGHGDYITDVLGERAAGLVADHLRTTPERPFFLYLAFTAPHWPLHAPAEDVERYRGRFDAGWDALRDARLLRLRELGLVREDAAAPPRDPRVPAWDAVPHRDWQARRMEVYAAMVSAMDRAAGRVIAALEEAAALEDTLVVFLSDNGACGEEFRGAYLFAPLVVPIPERTADGREIRFGDDPSIVPGPPDTFASYGRSWAHLSNTPLRLYKHWTHEGGIAVPFFVHWPAALAGRAGAIVDSPAHVVDLVPTVLELIDVEGATGEARTPVEGPAGAARPETQATLRGTSLLPLLRGEVAEPRTLYWEHEGNRAILDGDTKLVSRWPGSWELYDLVTDRGETDDLAAAQPDRAAELERLWSRWAADVGVEPWPIVVPQVRTAITVAATILFVLFAIRRAARGRRRGAAPSRPRPASERDPTAEPSSIPEAELEPEARRPPSPSTAGESPPPIRPR